MTQEEKQLLIKDLCSRLPYNVICKLSVKGTDVSITEKLDFGGLEHFVFGTMDVKPYLRPMSSMTEEERKEYNEYLFHGASIGLMSNTETAYELIDWLNKHYFDYRCLIDRGLALEAPEGMYKAE